MTIIKITVFLLLTLVCFGSTACLPNTGHTLAAFDVEMKMAEQAELKKDYVEAAQHYRSALEIAENGNWNGGIVTAKQNLASIYSINREYEKAEKSLSEAGTVCKSDPSCQGLHTIYDQQVYFYVFDHRDIGKALFVIDEAIENRNRLEQGVTISQKLEKYTDELRMAGFAEEARIVSERRSKY